MFRQSATFQKSDLEAIKMLEDFLPDNIYDAHAHLFDTDYMPGVATYNNERARCGLEEYRATVGNMLADPKNLRLNIIPFPHKSMADIDSENCKKSDSFLIRQLEKDVNNVGEIIVRPNETAEQLKSRMVHPNIKGFKCYHVMANKPQTWNCNIEEYLPESAWQLADEKGLYITLHMVKDLALADPANQKYIVEMAKKYPHAILILAHAARSFAAWTGIDSVERVAHLENVWFDFSAVCESPAMIQIIKRAGIKRCLWGSDYPVCQTRGKAISLGNSFYWIYENDIERFSTATPIDHWFVGLENLMAVRQAAILADCSRSDIEDLFYNNAARLFDNANT